MCCRYRGRCHNRSQAFHTPGRDGAHCGSAQHHNSCQGWTFVAYQMPDTHRRQGTCVHAYAAAAQKAVMQPRAAHEDACLAAGLPQRKPLLQNVGQDKAATPVRKTVAFTSVQETRYSETSEDEGGREEATPSPSADVEEFRAVEVGLAYPLLPPCAAPPQLSGTCTSHKHRLVIALASCGCVKLHCRQREQPQLMSVLAAGMQALLAEKSAELAGLAQRVAHMEARQGALQELRSLQGRTAQLKARSSVTLNLHGGMHSNALLVFATSALRPLSDGEEEQASWMRCGGQCSAG